MEWKQRLPLERLKEWERLRYGMFIHYGMSTYVQEECPDGTAPREAFAPDALDVRQWARTARQAGMRYIVLTTKHVAGHCLWPSKHTDYCVKDRDIVAEFVQACRAEGLRPGFYYCLWDNHNLCEAERPNTGYTGPEYWAFAQAQLEELATGYGDIEEFWVDIPGIVPRAIRHKLYNRLAQLQPNALIIMNHGVGDGTKFDLNYAWPSDVITIERFLPPSDKGYNPERDIEGKMHYLPGEVCDPIGREWFYVEGDALRSDAELLGMYLTATSRGANLLLDVPPDKSGRIPQASVDALLRLRGNLEKLQMWD